LRVTWCEADDIVIGVGCGCFDDDTGCGAQELVWGACREMDAITGFKWEAFHIGIDEGEGACCDVPGLVFLDVVMEG
jgi:hypothetical protein